MNEIDKMRKSELADMEKPEIQASFIHAKKLFKHAYVISTPFGFPVLPEVNNI